MTGPYAYVRNPLYLGSIIMAIGFAVAARDLWVAIAILVMFALIYVPVIRGEETFLRSHFPAYDDYARRVPRLLPRTLLFRQIMNGFSRAAILATSRVQCPAGRRCHAGGTGSKDPVVAQVKVNLTNHSSATLAILLAVALSLSTQRAGRSRCASAACRRANPGGNKNWRRCPHRALASRLRVSPWTDAALRRRNGASCRREWRPCALSAPARRSMCPQPPTPPAWWRCSIACRTASTPTSTPRACARPSW